MERVKFSESELLGITPGRFGDEAHFDYPCTPWENYKAMMDESKPLWMPMMNTSRMCCPRELPENIARGFVFDAQPPVDKEIYGGPDMFGTEWVYVPDVGGSMVRPGKPRMEDVNDWRDIITFPDINACDWEGCAKANAEYLGDPNTIPNTMLLNGFMFERLISFMEFENAAMAIIDEDQEDAVKEIVGEMLEKVYIPYLENIKKYLPQIKVIVLHDDWGTQLAPFFSLATARELFVPFMQRFAEKCKELDLVFELHSCGKNEKLVPAYIEGGVQVWSGMFMNDKRKLYDEYGDKIILGVDPPLAKDKNGDCNVNAPYVTQNPNASKEEMYAVAKEFCEYFIRDGKCHCIANTNRANPYFVEGVYYYSRQMLNA